MKLHTFVKHCVMHRNHSCGCCIVQENPQSQEDIQKVDEKVINFMKNLASQDKAALTVGTSATVYQGTDLLVKQIPVKTLNDSQHNETCNKDTGEKGRLRQRARGHFAAVSGGGNIICFNPIYKTVFFLQKESKDGITLMTSIHRSWKNGGGLHCFFPAKGVAEMMSFLDGEMRVKPNHAKRLIDVAGRQPDSDVIALNPELFINIHGDVLNDEQHDYVWVPELKSGPGPFLYRHVPLPVGTDNLKVFVEAASEVMEKNFAAFMFTFGAMTSAMNYQGVQEHVGHFNLPVCYGPPMTGKTLAATCVSLALGMRKNQITSSNTLTFVRSLVKKTTMPFLWDDPSVEKDICKFTVELGNAALCGKCGYDGDKPPLTGCLVTANFHLQDIEKYYSRVSLIPFRELEKEKKCGEGPDLERKAMAAANALPLLVKVANGLTGEDVAAIIREIGHADVQFRILAGVAIPLHFARQILQLCGLETLNPAVTKLAIDLVQAHRNKRPADLAVSLASARVSTALQETLQKLTEVSVIEREAVLQIYGDKVYIRLTEASQCTSVTKDRLREYVLGLGCAPYGNTFRFLVGGKKQPKKCAMVPVGKLQKEELNIVEVLQSQEPAQPELTQDHDEMVTAQQDPSSAQPDLAQPEPTQDEDETGTAQQDPSSAQPDPAQPEPNQDEDETGTAQQDPSSAQPDPAQPEPTLDHDEMVTAQQDPSTAQPDPAQPEPTQDHDEMVTAQQDPSSAQPEPTQDDDESGTAQQDPSSAQPDPAQPEPTQDHDESGTAQQDPSSAQPEPTQDDDESGTAQQDPSSAQPDPAQPEPTQDHDESGTAQQDPSSAQSDLAQPEATQDHDECRSAQPDPAQQVVHEPNSAGMSEPDTLQQEAEIVQPEPVVFCNSLKLCPLKKGETSLKQGKINNRPVRKLATKLPSNISIEKKTRTSARTLKEKSVFCVKPVVKRQKTEEKTRLDGVENHPAPPARGNTRPKFLNKVVSQLFEVEGVEKEYKGWVKSVVKGRDGWKSAIYEVTYEDGETLEINLFEDFLKGDVRIIG